MLPSARFFLCALCRKQVVVCRRCDRGQRYCSKTCSRIRRAQLQTEAKARYANSRAGRLNNAERQRRHQARLRDQKKPVPEIGSDQGSAPGAPPDNQGNRSMTAARRLPSPCTSHPNRLGNV